MTHLCIMTRNCEALYESSQTIRRRLLAASDIWHTGGVLSTSALAPPSRTHLIHAPDRALHLGVGVGQVVLEQHVRTHKGRRLGRARREGRAALDERVEKLDVTGRTNTQQTNG